MGCRLSDLRGELRPLCDLVHRPGHGGRSDGQFSDDCADVPQRHLSGTATSKAYGFTSFNDAWTTDDTVVLN
jgi:hypothetical protein